jgi:hypothetical protein
MLAASAHGMSGCRPGKIMTYQSIYEQKPKFHQTDAESAARYREWHKGLHPMPPFAITRRESRGVSS